jgi:hypothetical protein
MDYKQKYLKYKKKYLELKNQLGGKLPEHLVYPIPPIALIESNKSNKYIIRSHGVMTGKSFFIPAGINIINLSELENAVPLNKIFDNELFAIYDEKNTIFENNDNSRKKTDLGEKFENTWKSRSGFEKINFKNHPGPMIVNDMYLSFTGNCIGDACSVDVIEDFNKRHITKRNIKLNYIFHGGHVEEIKTILLSDLINFILGGKGINNYGGNFTFIINACRVYPREIDETMKATMRQNSNGK